MGTQYQQLCDAERKAIARLHAAGRSLRQIAATLVRASGTISREIRRNSRPSRHWPAGQYQAARAIQLTARRPRRARGHKLAHQPALRGRVGDLLAMGCSPEQIAGRLAHLHARTIISYESIYRFIYHRTAQKDHWNRLPPRRKHRRGRLGRRRQFGPLHPKSCPRQQAIEACRCPPRTRPLGGRPHVVSQIRSGRCLNFRTPEEVFNAMLDRVAVQA